MNALNISIISLVLIALSTTIGSALVFFFKHNFSKRVSSIVMGLASGIMLSVSIFGLLLPAMEDGALYYGNLDFLPVIIGFIIGCLVLYLLDKIVPHLHQNDENLSEGYRTQKLTKRTKFFLAVTMHNIPEGIAVGLAIAMAFTYNTEPYILSALSLAIAISIQNLPEGAAVSIPMLQDGVSKKKSFLYGFVSGLVEPIFAILTILIAQILPIEIMPWLLAFSAGAMIYVTVEELIPDIKIEDKYHFGMWSFIIGFLIMMALELLL